MTKLRSIATLLIAILFALCANAEEKNEWVFHNLIKKEKSLFLNDVSNYKIQIAYSGMEVNDNNVGKYRRIIATKDACSFALLLAVNDTVSLSCNVIIGDANLYLTATVMVDNSIKYLNHKISGTTEIPVNARLDDGEEHLIEFFFEGNDCSEIFSVGAFEFSSHHYALNQEMSIPPTCVEPGVNTYTCTDEGCDDEYTETIPSLGGDHQYEESLTVKGTCLFPTARMGTCKRCGIVQYLDNDKIPYQGADTTKLFQHDFGQNGECSRCPVKRLNPDTNGLYKVFCAGEFLYLNEQMSIDPSFLSADIKIFNDITIPAEFDLQPIGSENHPFTGTIGTDGPKRIIRGIRFNENELSDYVGLIGIAKGTPMHPVVISNLIIAPSDDDIVDENSDCSIEGKNYVGSIAGQAEYCDFNGCINMTDVKGASHVGGIVGQAGMGCHFTDCINIANILGTDTTTLSQIAGDTSIGYLMDCYASGKLYHNSNPYTPNTTESNFTNGMYAELRNYSTVLPDSLMELLNQVPRQSPVRASVRDSRSMRQNYTNWFNTRSGSTYEVVSDTTLSQSVTTYYTIPPIEINLFEEHTTISGGDPYRCDVITTYTLPDTNTPSDTTKLVYIQNFDIKHQNWYLARFNIIKSDNKGNYVSEMYECSADESEITLTHRLTIYPNGDFTEETLFNDVMMLNIECKVYDDNGSKRKVYYQYDPITHERITLSKPENLGTEDDVDTDLFDNYYTSTEKSWVNGKIQFIEYGFGTETASGILFVHDDDDMYDEIYYIYRDYTPMATNYITHTKEIPQDTLPEQDHPTDISPVEPEIPGTAPRKLPILVLDLNGRVLKCTFDSEDPLYDLPQGFYIINGRKLLKQ